MNEEVIEELKRLFYSNRLTQYGKRKLIEYYEQRIEELEEENKNYKKYAVMMSTEGLIINGVKFSFSDYIPKSKVREKIEELDKEKLKYDNDLRIYTLRNTFDFQKEVLQELLEKRK